MTRALKKAAAWAVAWSTAAVGTILHVPGDYPEIQSAINQAAAGDTVLVQPGKYKEVLDFHGKAIRVSGLAPDDPLVVEGTVVDGLDGDVMELVPGVLPRQCTIGGLTIRGGGIGVRCTHASPTLRHCFVLDNEDSGIRCVGAAPLIEDCRVASNRTYFEGGGLFCSGAAPRIERCVIEGNVAEQGGGGLYAVDSAVRMDASVIRQNSTFFGEGGGLLTGAGYLSLWHCAVVGNQGYTGGGMAVVRGSGQAKNCVFSGNLASNSGGGVWSNDHATVALEGCVLTGNTTEQWGGGVYAYDSTQILVNCTMQSNSAGWGGDALYVHRATVQANSSIFWDNGPEEIHLTSGELDITYSDIGGGWPGEGNIDEDPRFASRRGYSHLLQPNSPCIDMGDPALEDVLFDWHPRWPDWYPNEARADMGAYGGPTNRGWLP